MRRLPVSVLLLAASCAAFAQSPQVVDLPSRPGVTQRILVLTPEKPQAAVVLFAGGNGNIGIRPDGRIARSGNFLVRSRELFAGRQLLTVVIDAPSDRSAVPRETDDHVSDVKAVIAWIRQQADIPVWLVGTSRGTQSAAHVATRLARADGGPDGVVLTATMLSDQRGTAVPEMPLDRLRIPVLVAHHRHDGCRYCLFSDMPRLMERLTTPPRKELLVFEGGNDVGDPCQARAYHGFNGIEREVIDRITAWITAP
ncbi:MAG: alpha/beta hydrolase [Burkholderiales bacterium]